MSVCCAAGLLSPCASVRGLSSLEFNVCCWMWMLAMLSELTVVPEKKHNNWNYMLEYDNSVIQPVSWLIETFAGSSERPSLLT